MSIVYRPSLILFFFHEFETEKDGLESEKDRKFFSASTLGPAMIQGSSMEISRKEVSMSIKSSGERKRQFLRGRGMKLRKANSLMVPEV